MRSIPHDYAERVYAGVLGKLIGVYLGRPFEMWSHARILRELGPINYYVNERRDVALRSHHLVVTDDDVSGTFIFPQALADEGYPTDLTSRQIGQAWLNYIIEERTVLWWGGIGNSTEHTAYLRLKSGVPAPDSGSVALNGTTVAEQIGAQIFIDGWAMVSPGNPEQAARLAENAGRVSHDGESVYAAKLLAAMEAQAFVEEDVGALLETGLRFVPADSLIRRVVDDVRDWHRSDNSNDWARTRALIEERYGYEKFGGNCHVVPNHALIILAHLYGQDSFQETLRIATTAGWDTDCNAGNVGCLFGIRKGLTGIDAGPDFRSPVADRMYISSADGGRAITDAVLEARALVVSGHKLAGILVPPAPKHGARFHFSMPGSLQGFHVAGDAPADLHPARLRNAEGPENTRYLAIDFERLAPGRVIRVATPTFFAQDVFTMPIYALSASPTLHSGQMVEAIFGALKISAEVVSVRLFCSVYTADDTLSRFYGCEHKIVSRQTVSTEWIIPDTAGYPIYDIGLEIACRSGSVTGAVFLDRLTWRGAPNIILQRPDEDSIMWKHAWVNNASQFQTRWEGLRVSNSDGIGFISQGTRDWGDYAVSAVITPLLAERWGLAARVQGRTRYIALMFDRSNGGRFQLIMRKHSETVLAEKPFAWSFDQPYDLQLHLKGNVVTASVNGDVILDVILDDDPTLTAGAIALLVDTGSISTKAVTISSL